MAVQDRSPSKFTILQTALIALLPIAYLSSIAVTEILSWLFFLVILIQLIDQVLKSRIRWQDLKLGCDKSLWGFIIVSLISLFVNVDSGEVRMDEGGSLRWIFLLYALTFFFRRHLNSRWQAYLSVFVPLFGGLCVFSVLQYLYGLEPPRSRVVVYPVGDYFRSIGLFSLPLTYAGVVGIAGFLCLGMAWSLRDVGRKTLGSFGFLFGSLGVLLSLTRGAWLGWLGSVILTAAMVKIRYLVMTLIALSVVGGAVYSISPGVQKRIDGLLSKDVRDKNLRWKIWAANWEMVKEQPILGVGLGENDDVLGEYFEKIGVLNEDFRGHAHNNFLQVWAGQGTVALLFYFWFSGFFLWQSWRLFRMAGDQEFFRAIGLGAFAAQIHFHISGLTECNFIDGEVNHILIFTWALTLGARYRLENRGRSDSFKPASSVSSAEKPSFS